MGCKTPWGRASSACLWRKVFGKTAEIWIAEFDEQCVKEARSWGIIDGIKTLTGDQSNNDVLTSWIKQSGGQFDVIIDDGGHTNLQIMNSFNRLWFEALSPGGYYFMEDIHVGRLYDGPVVSDIISSWSKQMIGTETGTKIHDHKLPSKMKWIFCQTEACLFYKCSDYDTKRGHGICNN